MTKFLLTIITLTASLLFVGCTNADKSKPAADEETPTTLTSSDKQEIQKEISNLGKTFFRHVEKLDIDSCMNYFENTSDFWSVNPDGTAGDYNSLKKINGEGFSQMKSFSSKLNKESIRVLSKTQALYTYFATQEFVLITGEKMKMENVAGTMLLEKIGNSWKATFYQESAGQPVKVETQK
jgi:hypothetical protein